MDWLPRVSVFAIVTQDTTRTGFKYGGDSAVTSGHVGNWVQAARNARRAGAPDVLLRFPSVRARPISWGNRTLVVGPGNVDIAVFKIGQRPEQQQERYHWQQLPDLCDGFSGGDGFVWSPGSPVHDYCPAVGHPVVVIHCGESTYNACVQKVVPAVITAVEPIWIPVGNQLRRLPGFRFQAYDGSPFTAGCVGAPVMFNNRLVGVLHNISPDGNGFAYVVSAGVRQLLYSNS